MDSLPSSDRRLMIVGASVRAAAASALRGGLRVSAIDLFADRDLQLATASERVERYPNGFLSMAEEFPAMPWMYTGGLENYPRVVGGISQRHRLDGNRPEVLREVRRPERLASVLRADGFHMPRMSDSPHGIPTDGSWLLKRRRSSGGRAIRRWRGGAWPGRDSYLQEFHSGNPQAAVFVMAGGEAVLLGVTQQLVGLDPLTDTAVESDDARFPFAYSGSMGPVSIDKDARSWLDRLGRTLSRKFGLVGLVGVDFVWRSDSPRVIEVNPRYPASVEILERVRSFSAVSLHVAACRKGDLSPALAIAPPISRQPPAYSGKLIVHACGAGTVSFRLAGMLSDWGAEVRFPLAADVPAAWTPLAGGDPIATIFADGTTPADIRRLLQERSARVQESFQR